MDAAVAERIVADRLRELRTGARWSQSDVASRMNERGWPWHQQTVGRVERGQQALRIGELADLAALFGVSPCGLLAAEDHDPAAERRAVERAIREQIAAEITASSRPGLEAA